MEGHDLLCMYLAHHEPKCVSIIVFVFFVFITNIVMSILMIVENLLQVYMESILECYDASYCGVWRPACVRAH